MATFNTTLQLDESSEIVEARLVAPLSKLMWQSSVKIRGGRAGALAKRAGS